MIISMIVAVGKNLQIGLENKMLWHIKAEFQHFKKTTMGHTLLMGRKTFQSIGRALSGRRTIVLTRDKEFVADGVEVAHSFEEAYEMARASKESELFIVGGAEVYKQYIDSISKLYLTEVDYDGDADTYFPDYLKFNWEKERSESHGPIENAPAWSLSVLTKVAGQSF